MQGATALVAAIAAFFIIFSRPSKAMAPYVIALAWYPVYLTVPIGTVDFNVSRILVMVLIMRLLFVPGVVSRFRPNWADAIVLIAFLTQFTSYAVNESMEVVFVRQMGSFFDTFLVYIAARLSIQSKDDFIDFATKIIIASIPLACLGLYQAFTGHNPYGFTKAFDAWDPREQSFENRYGWFRADVSFNLNISFGLYFAMLLALAIGLWHQLRWSKRSKVICVAFMGLGLFSSMSSGPLFAAIFSLGLIGIYRWRQHWFYYVVAAIAVIVAIEMYSNRHFPHVLGRLAFSTQNVYYRVGLWEEAFGGGMDDHWVFGYGFVGLGVGNDNSEFNWEHKDFLNIYIARLVRCGLFATIPYFVMTFMIYHTMRRGFARAPTEAHRWMIWCLIAGQAGWHIGLMTVGLLSQMLPFYYLMFAVSINVAKFYEPVRARSKGMKKDVVFPGADQKPRRVPG